MKNRKTALDLDQSLIAGIKKYLMSQSFIIGKQSYTPQQIIDLIQGRVTTGQAVIPAKNVWVAAIKADKDEHSKTRTFVRGFTTIVQGMFNEVPDTLAEFGLKPRKSPKTTVAIKSTAIAKNKATRKARGTKGKKQKAGVKGTVPVEPPQGASPGPAPVTPPKPTA